MSNNYGFCEVLKPNEHVKIEEKERGFEMKLTYSRFIAAVFCILLSALIGVSAGATTYYVSATGSDSNDGLTEATAWLSIDRGDRNGVLQPGDVVQVAEGTYDIDAMSYDAFTKQWGFTTRVCSGNALAPITYRAQGNVTINLGAGNARTWWVISSYLVIDGFHINGGGNGVNIREGSMGCEVKNCWFSNSPLPVETVLGAGEVKIHNNVIGPSTWRGMHINSSWSGTVYGTTYVYNNTFVSIPDWAFVNWTPTILKNNIFSACGNIMYACSASILTNSNNMIHWGVYGVTYGGFALPGANEVENDPMFADPGANNYHLQTGSPAIDAGTPVGMPYNGSAPDMGAFETDGTVVAPGIVTGTVTDSVTGQPVSGVSVQLIDGSGTLAAVSTATGADGIYSLTWDAGTYALNTTGKRGYRSSRVSATFVNNTTQTVNIQIAPATSPMTFYVSTTGNDTNDGTSEATAWATVGKGDAENMLYPGDTVIVLAGYYDINFGSPIVLTNCGGTAASPITYRAQGDVTIARGAVLGAVVTLTGSAKHIVLDGFHITGGSPVLEITTGGAGVAMTGDEIKNCWLSNKTDVGHNDPTINMKQVGGNKIHHNLIDPQSSVVARGIQSWASPGGDKIYNNTIVNTSDWAFLYLTTTQPMEFKNNIISGSPSGIYCELSGLVNANNILFNVTTPYGGVAAAGTNETTDVDPLLTYDYHLNTGSPAIDTGVFVGLSHNGSAPDLGAFETAGTATNTGVVSGRITAAGTGVGLSGALVQLTDGSSTVLVSTTTDSSGYYSISWLAGSWTVAVSNVRGYDDASSPVTIVSDSTTTLDFALDAVVVTYYVSPTGSDSNNGTSETTAWATINKGDRDNLLNPGDTVVVLPGTYSASGTTGIALNMCGGNAGAPITYRAQGNVIIDRGANTGAALSLTGAAKYIVLDGFHITGGNPILEITTGTAGAAMTNDEVKNCRLSNKAFYYNWPALNLYFAGGNKIHHNVIDPQSVAARGIQAWGSFGGDQIYNNTCINTTDYAFIAFGSTQSVELKNNIAYGSPTGIYAESLAAITHTNNLMFNVATPYGGAAVAGTGETTSVDPMLVNPANGDLRLRVGSPAIDTGVDVGLPFLGSAPDLGALETDPTMASVAGIVTDNTAGNAPLAGATVRTVGGAVVSTLTNSYGAYPLDLAAGSYTLEASKADYLPLQKPVVVANGGVTVVDFALNMSLTDVAKIPDIKPISDGDIIRLTDKVVTVDSDVFGDGIYYIEEPDRYAGIKVVGGPAVTAGDRVTLIGALGTDTNGERFLQYRGIVKAAGDKLGPLAMTNKSLGGGNLGFQPGVTGATGANNIGLLVKTWGKVSSPVDTVDEYGVNHATFALDDGSGVVVNVQLPAGLHTPDADSYGCVTGISSIESGDRLLKSTGNAYLPLANYADDTFGVRTILGFTEDPNHWMWVGADAPGSAVSGGLLNCLTPTGAYWCIPSIEGFKPADFTLEARVRINEFLENGQSLIAMRQGTPNTPIDNGYFLAIIPNWRDTAGAPFNNEPGWLLMYHNGKVGGAAYYVAHGHLDGYNWSEFHTVTITANGNSWSGTFDGTTIFTDIHDTGAGQNLNGGYLGFGEIGANVDYDYIHITTP